MRAHLDSGENLDVIPAEMEKGKQTVYLKARRLGLKEEVTKHGASSSSNEIELPAELPIVETALKVLLAPPNN